MAKQDAAKTESPFIRASFLSKVFSCWIFPLIRLGNEREFEKEDIYKVLDEDSTRNLGSRLGRRWDAELSRPSPSLFRALFKTFGSRFFCLTAQFIIIDSLRMIQSVVLGFLLQALDGHYPKYVGYAMAAALIIMNFTYVVVRQTRIPDLELLGMNICVAVSNKLYIKSLKLSQKSLAASSVGQAMNYLSNDLNRYERGLSHLPYLFSCPIQIILGICILWYYIGFSSLAGFALLLIFTTLQSYAGKMIAKITSSVVQKTDIRLKTMGELLKGILLVKTAAWENHYTDLIEKARSEEMGKIRLKTVVQAINFCVYDASNKIAFLLTLITFIYTGNLLTAQTMFVTLSLYNTLWILVTRWFPPSVSGLLEMLMSTRRLENYLLQEEKYESDEIGTKDSTGILLQNISATWSDEGSNVLQNINLDTVSEFGRLIGITGAVGSGKSSLLQVILGELPVTHGQISVNGTLAYVTQDPWLFSGTIRENIVLGQSFDQKWFEEVVEACALSRDFKAFPFRDLTLVGDRGVTLSGGQKARINLARAVYRKADIYLLDDPLSAVDNLVGRHLMDKCITGLLKTKCVFLVTHQTRYLQGASEILVMRHGRTPERRLFKDLMGHDETPEDICATVDELLESEELFLSGSVDLCDGMSSTVRGREYGTFKSEKGEQAEQETRSIGTASCNVWNKYLNAGNSTLAICIFWITCIISQFLLSSAEYWLKIWMDAIYQSNDSSTVMNNDIYISVYAGIIAAMFISGLIRTLWMFRIFISSSIQLHRAAFSSVLRAPMRFFEVNSMGRVMNRFSNDMGNVDEGIHSSAYLFVMVHLG